MRLYPRDLDTLFNKYGYHIYDTSNLRTLASSDNELIDAVHGSEKTYARLLVYLAEREPVLERYVDVVRVKSKIDAVRSILVF